MSGLFQQAYLELNRRRFPVVVLLALIGGWLITASAASLNGVVGNGTGLGASLPSSLLPETIPISTGAGSGLSASLGATQVETDSWPMAGANPQRTSWTPEQVPSAAYLQAHRSEWNNGELYPQWVKPIEPYIPHKVQVIAANNLLYISTARGLYALDAATGTQVWVYPTELPLGNSPTISGGVAYVGGLDKKLYALDAETGQEIWSFEATQGFETNPLVVGGLVYAGNRDGYFYALHVDGPSVGQLAWKYQTGGPILFSAAYTVTAANPGGVVYFASNDSYAYALDAQTGALVWKSAKLPGAGFHSWWPVVYQSYVVFAGSSNYRDNVSPGASCNCNIDQLDREAFPNAQTAPRGTPVGPRGADGWIDASAITSYFQAKPWRRTYLVLDQSTGQEVTPYAPVLWHGTQSGNRYPPIVGADGIIYQSSDFMSDAYINGGGVSGWRIGTPYISTPATYWWAIDEPLAYSAGGNIIYWVYHDDLAAGGFDISVPNTRFWDHGQPDSDPTREWTYWNYNLRTLLPGYDSAMGGTWTFGGANGVYERNGDQNPLIPYQGNVYVIRGNAVLAFGPAQVQPATLPMATVVAAADSSATVDWDLLKQKLSTEVQNIISAGHLRPGFLSSGHVDASLVSECADNLQDYWHDPSDTLYALLRALPYLPADLHASIQTYLQTEYSQYITYTHIGWADGAAREAFDLPPEVDAARASFGPSTVSSWGFQGWGGQFGGTGYPPHLFYVLWKYAQVFPGAGNTNARNIFDANKSKLSQVPGDDILAKYPFVHNSFIAGYIGYLNLQTLAGYAQDADIRAELNRLLALRSDTFSKDTPYVADSSADNYCRALSVSRNFLFLVPELGTYLHDNALGKVQSAIDEYSWIEPYWFVSAYEDTIGEAEIQPLYDANALLQARAYILGEPANRLIKYLDVPGFQVGDLLYIQNLETLLESENIDKAASQSMAYHGDVINYTLTIGSPLTPTLPITVTDTWPSGLQHSGGLCSASSGTPVCGSTTVSWSGPLPSSGEVVISYTTQVATSQPQLITNQMLVDGGAQGVFTRTATLWANPLLTFLPLISR